MAFRNRKKYVIITIILLTISVLLFYNKHKRLELYSKSEFFMDTLVTIKVKDRPGAEEAVERSFAVMKDWAVKFDRYENDSVITDINRNGFKGVRVSEEILRLFITAGKYYQFSDGAFDITIAPLLDLWGFGKKEQRVPDREEIEKTLAKIGFNKLVIDRENKIIYLKPEMKVDLGGIAKGFVLDKGIKSLKEMGIRSAFINAGGNIRVLGKKQLDRPWHIGIRKPRQEGQIFSNYVLALVEGSVATSGDYERYFTYKGRRYSHLIDPRTGYQARDMQAVTIYAPDALTADLLSTTVFLVGWEEGQKLINNLAGIEGFMVKNEENIWLSDGFKNLVINR